jgi:hypothetical protein
MMMYLKYGIRIQQPVLDYISSVARVKPRASVKSENQRLVVKTLKSTEYKQLFVDHILMRSDKNMGIAVVSLHWKVNQCNLALNDKKNYHFIKPSRRDEKQV